MKEVQRDPVARNVRHVDFQQISLTEVITVHVPLHVKGTAKAVLAEGGLVDPVVSSIDVRATAANIPNEIVVDVTNMTMDSVVRLGDLQMPAGAPSSVTRSSSSSPSSPRRSKKSQSSPRPPRARPQPKVPPKVRPPRATPRRLPRATLRKPQVASPPAASPRNNSRCGKPRWLSGVARSDPSVAARRLRRWSSVSAIRVANTNARATTSGLRSSTNSLDARRSP